MWICLKLVDIISEEDIIYLASIFIFNFDKIVVRFTNPEEEGIYYMRIKLYVDQSDQKWERFTLFRSLISADVS